MDRTRLSNHLAVDRPGARTQRRACPVTPRFSTPVPPSADAADVARAFAEAHLCEAHATQAAGAVLLLVSELVTHALFYGAPPIVVTIECEVDRVRVTVTDGSPLLETPDSVHRQLSLRLVDNVAGAWGLETSADGETFWCTVPTRLS
jgi:hypothetical protein